MPPTRPPAGAPEPDVEERAAAVRRHLPLTQEQRLAIRRHVAEKGVTVDDSTVYDWESQAAQYPESGPPGTEVLRLTFERSSTWINCILHRDQHGRLNGILNHYPVDIPPYEKASTLNVWVHPDHRGKGVATTMVLAAMEQGWAIDLEAVAVTGPGLALTQSVARRVRRDVDDEDDAPEASALPLVTVRPPEELEPLDGPEGPRLEDVRSRLALDTDGVSKVVAHVGRREPDVAETAMLSWQTQAVQYPPDGRPGIRTFVKPLPSGTPVNCLLYRGTDGTLLGILNHYPVDVPPLERANTLNVWVHPEHRGQGIGSEMILAAIQRGWAIDVERVRLTAPGLAVTSSVTRRVAEAMRDLRPGEEPAGPRASGSVQPGEEPAGP